MAKPSASSGFLQRLGKLFSKDVLPPGGITSETSADVSDLMSFFKDRLNISHLRSAKYNDFVALDDEPLPSRALDVYSTLVTLGDLDEDETSSTYKVVSKNSKQMEIFAEMEKRLDLKRRLYGLVRTGCKFGMNAQEIIWANMVGASSLKYIAPESFFFTDESNPLGGEFPYVQKDGTGREVAKFRDFQVMLLRFGDDESRVYGRSVLETVRKTAKIIEMLESSMAFREINRAVQSWMWLIDATGLGPEEALNYAQKIMTRYNKPRYVDAKGQLNLARSPVFDMRDIALPVFKDGAPVDIRALPKDSAGGSLELLRHFYAKFFGGVAVPNYYFSFEGARQIRSVGAMSFTDIVLAKSVFRYQSAVSSSAWELYNNESKFHGIEDEEFRLVFPIMSTVDQMMVYNLLNLKVQIANTLRIQMKMVDDEYVYKLLKFDGKEVARFNKFRKRIQDEERQMIQAAADGVFLQPVTTSGNTGQSAYDVVTPAERQAEAGMQAMAGQGSQLPPGESMFPSSSEVSEAYSRRIEQGQMKVIQERLNSERTLQAILQDMRIKNSLENVAILSKMMEAREAGYNPHDSKP